MCEYCGCQSLRSIDELTQEHTAALALIRTAREQAAANDAPAAAGTAHRLLALLDPHTAVEEGALFPAMAREHPAHVAALQQEHRRVHAALAGMAAGGARQDWRPALEQALDLLSEHIFKEQDGLFPAALTSLGAADWELVEQVRSRVGSVLQPSDPS